MPSKIRLDPFAPVLLDENTQVAVTTQEQIEYIKKILDTASSDSKFAEKAYNAIVLVLTAGKVTNIPTVDSIDPTSVLRETAVELIVAGTNFGTDAKVQVAGLDVATTRTSDTELKANFTTSAVVQEVPVAVVSKGIVTDPVMLSITDVAGESKEEDEEDTTPEEDETNDDSTDATEPNDYQNAMNALNNMR